MDDVGFNDGESDGAKEGIDDCGERVGDIEGADVDGTDDGLLVVGDLVGEAVSTQQ